MKKESLVVLFIFLIFLSACSTGPADGSGTQAVAGDSSQQAPEPQSSEPALGTRQNPVPLGTKVAVGPNWNIAVLDINPDAWAEIEATNQFNDPPVEGRQFVLANIQVSYDGEESGTPWVDLRFRYLGSDGNVYGGGSDDYCGVLPESLSDRGEQFPGSSAEGNECWSVPSGAIVGGAIIAEESFSFDDTRVFFEGSR